MRLLNQQKSLLASTARRTVFGRLPVIAPDAQPRKAVTFRLSTRALVSFLALLASAPLGYTQDAPSLMTMISKWQYPGSKINSATMSDAATLNGAGERTVQSIQYKTVLTTPDPMPKVIEYYKAKLASPADSRTTKREESPTTDSGQSVTFHEDSEGRPVAIHVVLVNTEKASTTLVISRATTESETHIAWTHYAKL
jgi:hypothetical protein